ncbi:MAG: beta-aspartyl-peptidase [Myxococcales bacterium]|nr:beta-aspartyl-peptidase [Myxococcales bacterium]MBL0196275.1 beta-aspartyl-peptidase [Myxococcales bacterium]
MPRPLTLLRNATLYDPEARGVVDLLVGAGSVLAVGASLDALPAALCATVDLAGARVVPGLLDPHVHLTGGGGESGPSSRVPRVEKSALVRAGVTTCVGVLGTDGTTRTVAELVATTLALREEGLSAYCWTGSYEVPVVTLTGSLRRDVVFVDPVLGAGEIAISDHRSSQPTLEELARLAADCHVAGLMSGKAGVLHLHLGDGARGLAPVRELLDTTELPPRVFYPTHVNRKRRLFDEAVALARRGCTVDVTAFPVEDGEDAYSAADAVARYFASGAPRDKLTVSSDGGGCLPTYDAQGTLLAMDVGRSAALGETLAELLASGLPLDEALPPFTSNISTLLRLSRKGHLRPGADADLLVLDDTHRIRDVMARGTFVLRDGTLTTHGTGTFEPQTAK